jgi:TctA family transporter
MAGLGAAMTDFTSHLLLGLQVAAQPINLLFCFFGTLFGTMIGVLPGIGPVAAIAILLPVTFYLDPIPALTMLAGIYYGSQYGGSTTSILVKVPGESASVVTCLDGHEMARRGRAGAALAIAAIGSFIAGIVGTTLIVLFGPLLAKIAGAFGSAEYFALMVLGLAAAVVMAHGSLIGAVAMILLGLVLGLVGRDINTGFPRLTFGVFELQDGIGFVPLAMGVFGIAEIMHNLDRPSTRATIAAHIGRLWLTREEWRRAWPAVLRGTGFGVILGILPGGGSIIASFSSYGLEKRVARQPEEFGRGAIEGVAGPESANNAAAQASFIPLLTLGIPPNAVLALLVGGMMIHGITPGPNVISEQPRLFWGLVISMFIGNLMLVIINLPLVGIWVQVLKVPYRMLFPAIFLFCCIGVYGVNNSVFEVLLTIGFAFLGYFMLKVGLEPAPLLLGFVLGPLIEEHLRRTLMLSRGSFAVFLHRPLALAMLALAALLLILTLLPRKANRREEVLSEAAGKD